MVYFHYGKPVKIPLFRNGLYMKTEIKILNIKNNNLTVKKVKVLKDGNL